MGLLATLGWAVGFAVVGLVAYAVACAAVLSLVRLPDEGVFVVIEDVLFVVTLPFVLVVVVIPALRR